MEKKKMYSTTLCIDVAKYKRKSNTKIKKRMQKMNFITKERIRRFSNQDFSLMTIAVFLYQFFDKKAVHKALLYLGVRMDTRNMCDGKFASITPFIDEWGKIRDVWMMLFDPQNGTVLQDGDDRAMIQNSRKQNKKAQYFCQPLKMKQWSLIHELSQGYDFDNGAPTLLNMDKVNQHKHVYILSSVVDVLVMTLLCPEYGWMAIAPDQDFSILLHPNIAKNLRWKKIKLYPQFGSYEEAKSIEYQLSCMGMNVKTDSLVEQVDFEWKREETSIATIALNMLSEGFSPQDAITYLGFGNDEPF